MTSKGRRGQGKRTKQTKGKNIPAAIDTIKRDYQQVFSKLRENNTRAFSKAERVLQHIKALYDDPQLPSEFEVQVSDLYENINNDIEALNFVKKVGTTIKTAAQAEEENEKAHQTWVTVVNNRQTRQRTKLLPLLSAIERGNNVKRKSRSSVKASKKKKRISDTSKKQSRASKKFKSPKVSAKKTKLSHRAPNRPALSPKSAKKAAGLSAPLKRGLRTSPRNTTDVWSFDNENANSTSVRVAKKKTRNTAGAKVKPNRKGGQKIATRKNARREIQNKDKKRGVKVAKKSQPKRETRDERRQRKQKEVIEQVNVFDFDDVADPYA